MTRSHQLHHADQSARSALQRHWNASDSGDFKLEHEIYREDAVLDYPQSGERIRGRHNIQESRFIQPNKKRFTVGSAVTCASAFRGAHRLDRRNVKLLQGLECG